MKTLMNKIALTASVLLILLLLTCCLGYAQFTILRERTNADLDEDKKKGDIIKKDDWIISIKSIRTTPTLSLERFNRFGVTEKTLHPKNGTFVLITLRAIPTKRKELFPCFYPIHANIFLVDKEGKKMASGGWFQEEKGVVYDTLLCGERTQNEATYNVYFDAPDRIADFKLHISDEYPLLEIKK